MRGSVPLRMPVAVGPGNHFVEDGFHVGRHIGVGILINRDAGGGVGNKNRDQSGTDILLFYEPLNGLGYVDKIGAGICLDAYLIHA